VVALVAGGFYLRWSPAAPDSGTRATAVPGAVIAARTADPCGPAGAPGAVGALCAGGPVSMADLSVRHSRASGRTAGDIQAAPAPDPSPAASADKADSPPDQADSPADQADSPADQVLWLINRARAQAGLAALVFSAGLEQSAAAHNMDMARGCGLEHQCAGEAGVGAREDAAGVDWTSSGENIGQGGPEPDTTAAIAQMALTLTQNMLDEKPPDDPHRRNILSSSFGHIGIAVYEDSSGIVWMTQDFSG
jgi:uncharacterized protein YkwD